MHILVLMLCRKIELVFFNLLRILSCSKIGPKSLYYRQGCWPNFARNVKLRILGFYNIF